MGCDVAPPTPVADTPCVRVAGVWVTTGYDDAGRPIRTELGEGRLTEGVATTTTLEIKLGRFALPASVTRQAICLQASTAAVQQLDSCNSPGPEALEPRYSVVERSATYHQPSGNALAPSTFYRLTIYPPTDQADYGFRAFDRAPLDRVYVLDFRTAPEAAPAHEEPPPTAERYCAAVHCAQHCRASSQDPTAQQACIAHSCDCLDEGCFGDGDLTAPDRGIFAASCAFGGCHSGGNPAAGVPWGGGDAAMGLDLGTPDAIEWTAINRVAHETATGEGATTPEVNPARFGRSMPLVMPASPGNSYLLYKAAAQLLNHPPADTLDTDFLAELERLRESALLGQPMPLAMPMVMDVADPDGKLSWERLKLLEAWIGAGAVTRCP